MLILGKVLSFDERRDLIVLNDASEAISFAKDHWIRSAKRAMQRRGFFAVALSGGSTPRAIYQKLSEEKDFAWDKVHLFWSDERAHPPTHPDSNYHMAMEAGLKNLPIPPSQIHRMKAEEASDAHAKEYQEIIERLLGKQLFDLVMLGMGKDGHTASLFPNSSGLEEERKLVVVNSTQEKGLRMTLTFPCINQSEHIAIYALGKEKGEMLAKVLEAPILSPWPASRVGTLEHKALWIVDKDAAGGLLPLCKKSNT